MDKFEKYYNLLREDTPYLPPFSQLSDYDKMPILNSAGYSLFLASEALKEFKDAVSKSPFKRLKKK